MTLADPVSPSERAEVLVDEGDITPAHFAITHRTIYRYRQPVSLNPHHLRLRPRDELSLRVLSYELVVEGATDVRSHGDVYGNIVATASFELPTDTLIIAARSHVEKRSTQWPVFDIEASAITYPFNYDSGTGEDLGGMMRPAYPDPEGAMKAWADGFVYARPTDTLSLLKDVSAGVSDTLAYQIRDAEGTQSPEQSLARRRGTCRDYAVLFADAVRHLGFGSRLVSGYLYADEVGLPSDGAADTTHAWVEVFLPGAGWIAFDPTNRRMGDFHLIPVAVGTDIDRMMPVAGSFVGPHDALSSMTVEVSVTRMEA